MSNISREINWGSLTTVLRFVLSQWMKTIHTALPGLIETFDAETRRARVRIALQLVPTGERPDIDGEPMDRAPLVNVPVLFPSAGGFTMTFAAQEGDPVMLLFSERGIADFKRTYEQEAPVRGHFFQESDAVALPGFGPLTLTPFTTDTAVTIQRNDGTAAVSITGDRIDIHVADGQTVNLGGPSGQKLVTEDFLARYNDHTHPVATMPPLVNFRATGDFGRTMKTRGE